MAHLSSVFHVSQFDEAVALSVDGFGDFTSTASGFASGIDINIEQRVFFLILWGFFTKLLHNGCRNMVMNIRSWALLLMANLLNWKK